VPPRCGTPTKEIGDVGDGAPVLATQAKPLDHPQAEQNA
jgi:hypothetical protein